MSDRDTYHAPGQYSDCSPLKCGHPSPRQPTPPAEPRTAAGRALLGTAYLSGDAQSEGVDLREAILAIEAEAAAPVALRLMCEGSCGDLSWTIKEYGYPTHKHACRRRNRCQSHPDGCPEAAAPADCGCEHGHDIACDCKHHAAAPAGLDVERLKQALINEGYCLWENDRNYVIEDGDLAGVAAEYARLLSERGTER